MALSVGRAERMVARYCYHHHWYSLQQPCPCPSPLALAPCPLPLAPRSRLHLRLHLQSFIKPFRWGSGLGWFASGGISLTASCLHRNCKAFVPRVFHGTSEVSSKHLLAARMTEAATRTMKWKECASLAAGSMHRPMVTTQSWGKWRPKSVPQQATLVLSEG